MFEFNEGINNDVDMNFGIKTSSDSELVKNLKEEGAIVFEFAHEGVLPGPMKVSFYSKAHDDKISLTGFILIK